MGTGAADDRSAYVAAAKYGLIGFNMPEKYGGGGSDDFRFNAVIVEELAKFGSAAPSLSLQNDIVGPYLKSLATDEQQARWLPGYVSGELIGAVAMSEPGAGSDLAGIRTSAVRDGEDWILNGVQDVHLRGHQQRSRHRGRAHRPERRPPRFLVAGGRARHGRLQPRAQAGQDGPARAGHRRVALRQCTGPRPRTCWARKIAASTISCTTCLPSGCRSRSPRWPVRAKHGVAHLQYAKDRHAFGQPIGTFQHNRFVLAELDTELDIAECYVDRCLRAVVDDELTAVEAAKAKWWCTELAKKVVDACVQLHGGYGYMNEYRVARDYVDTRIQTIYGGTTEIMKDIIGRDFGL